MLQSIDSSVGNFDLLIQSQERCLNLKIKYLKSSNIDQQSEDWSELLPALLNGMSTPFKPDLTHCVLIILELSNSKGRDQNTRNVVFRLF